jgi:hypothetical protein
LQQRNPVRNVTGEGREADRGRSVWPGSVIAVASARSPRKALKVGNVTHLAFRVASLGDGLTVFAGSLGPEDDTSRVALPRGVTLPVVHPGMFGLPAALQSQAVLRRVTRRSRPLTSTRCAKADGATPRCAHCRCRPGLRVCVWSQVGVVVALLTRSCGGRNAWDCVCSQTVQRWPNIS